MIHGQSNAAGDMLPTEIASDLKGQTQNCTVFNLLSKNVEIMKVGVNSYGVPEEYADQFNVKIHMGWKYGIEIELSTLLRNHYNTAINLFKWTWPGSGLNSLGQGGNWAFTSGNLMPKVASDYAIYRTKVKSNENERFLIWIQGESNVSNPTTNKNNIKTWIDTYRTTLGFNIPLIVVTLSTNQTFINSAQLLAFRDMQLTLGSVVYNSDTNVFTTQSGFIDNCFVLNQNSLCQNEAGVFIHYSPNGLSNIAKGVFEIVKNRIIK